MRLTDSGAQFSSDHLYRYALWRTWDEARGHVMFVGLNPSTANETEDDPTVRRCMGFAQGWGYGGLHMLNIFAWRATDPRRLLHVADPVGPQNNQILVMYAGRSARIMACWGNMGQLLNRGQEVRELIAEMQCFGVTKAGEPRHPLYLPKVTIIRSLPLK